MRLEVLADNRNPVIYVLNRPEIYIGSLESNDIAIHSSEISKKHLKLIITDDGKCFVIDQGSTNGSFIDDERLVPGKREEFKLLTSMRLGDKVLLTLLDKDRGDFPELPLREQFVEENNVRISDEDKTRVISLKTLQKTKTEKVKKKRLKKLEKEIKKKKRARKDKETINRALITALVIIGLGWGAMKFVSSKRKARATIVSQIKETQIRIDDSIESLEENIAENLIPKDQLIKIEDIAKHAEDINCSLPEEAFFCKRMPRGSKKKNGAFNLNNQLVIYLEQKEWNTKAQELLSAYAELKTDENVESRTVDNSSMELINRIAFFTYLKTYLSAQIPPDIQSYNIYVVFYSHIGSSVEIQSVTAIKGSMISVVNARFTEDYFRNQKYDPFRIIKKLERYFHSY